MNKKKDLNNQNIQELTILDFQRESTTSKLDKFAYRCLEFRVYSDSKFD